MRKLFCKCAVLALTTAFAALCAMAAEYDVTRYGARPDGKSDNTAAIQKAIDDCAAKGGGRVLVPGGGKYVTYTLNLKNDVDLHIDRGARRLPSPAQHLRLELQQHHVRGQGTQDRNRQGARGRDGTVIRREAPLARLKFFRRSAGFCGILVQLDKMENERIPTIS